MTSGGCLPLPRGYINVHDHNIETSSLKLLGQLKPNFMWSIISLGKGNETFAGCNLDTSGSRISGDGRYQRRQKTKIKSNSKR